VFTNSGSQLISIPNYFGGDVVETAAPKQRIEGLEDDAKDDMKDDTKDDAEVDANDDTNTMRKTML
jgi:hypothetical protein